MKNILRSTGLASLLLLCIATCYAQTPQRFDVVIDELFPDPTPVIGLPNNEFVELKNVSATAFNLRGWKLSDGTSTATINVNFILQPDSFVIVCPNSAVTAFAAFGTTLGVSSFPSLNNDADVITLYGPNGSIIHSVAYNTSWYHNDVKSDGGWTLEMIDTHNPCSGSSNWTSSNHHSGGTPGRKNSVDGINKDEQPPVLLRTYTINDTTIVAVFDEPVDSVTAALITSYSINNGIGYPLSALPVAPSFTEVRLRLSTPLNGNMIYQLSVNNVQDCSNNKIGSMSTARTGLPVTADSFDIVVNELLFDPVKDGYDYIELYNRSNHIIDLKQLNISNRNTAGNLTNIKQLAPDPYLFFPGEYLVFTAGKQWVQQNYVVKRPDNILELPSLPSFPDDKGIAVLTNLHGRVIDELSYEAKWHFSLISNREGVALERISYEQPTQHLHNWTSAASTAGYGTPGYVNSQLGAAFSVQGQLEVTPRIFSPDNDGIDDYITISYRVTGTEHVANVTVYDVQGRQVRYLVKNALLGTSGSFRWDGLDEKANKLPLGIYIIVSEIFNQQGQKQKFKNAVTLARRL